jgi:outer membrane protein assembly factor BamB
MGHHPRSLTDWTVRSRHSSSLYAAVALSCLAPLFLLADASAPATASSKAPRVGGDWIRFGYDAARHGAGPTNTSLTARDVGRLVRRHVVLDGAVDSSPIYLRNALVKGHRHDVFIATTSSGTVSAVDADSGRVLWRFVPAGHSSWVNSYQITTSSPAGDPSRAFVYSAAPNGFIYKIRISTGAAVHAAGWPVRVTRDAAREKISSALNVNGNLLLATTSSFGDVGDYQGHLIVIDRRSGHVVRVWNALCSHVRTLLKPGSCPWAGASIWARAGVVVQPGSHNLLVATANGVWDGITAWSNSVIILSPTAKRVVGSWTPRDWADLATADLDLGSTAPALLTRSLAVQGGKDGKLRLLDLSRLEKKSTRTLGGELETIPGPGGGFYATPAVWRTTKRTWVFVTTDSALAAYSLARNRLVLRWRRAVPGLTGTSPVVAGGLLYMHDVAGRTLGIYQPTSGRIIARLPVSVPGHWSSPIVTDGRIALGEGNANAQDGTGALDIWRVAQSSVRSTVSSHSRSRAD